MVRWIVNTVCMPSFEDSRYVNEFVFWNIFILANKSFTYIMDVLSHANTEFVIIVLVSSYY